MAKLLETFNPGTLCEAIQSFNVTTKTTTLPQDRQTNRFFIQQLAQSFIE